MNTQKIISAASLIELQSLINNAFALLVQEKSELDPFLEANRDDFHVALGKERLNNFVQISLITMNAAIATADRSMPDAIERMRLFLDALKKHTEDGRKIRSDFLKRDE